MLRFWPEEVLHEGDSASLSRLTIYNLALFAATPPATRAKGLDANDILYQVAASRNYDSSGQLDKITAPVMWINSADDFINPPELGIAEEKVKQIRNARFILLPASDHTFGHGTHTHAEVWKQHLQELLEKSAH